MGYWVYSWMYIMLTGNLFWDWLFWPWLRARACMCVSRNCRESLTFMPGTPGGPGGQTHGSGVGSRSMSPGPLAHWQARETAVRNNTQPSTPYGLISCFLSIHQCIPGFNPYAACLWNMEAKKKKKPKCIPHLPVITLIHNSHPFNHSYSLQNTQPGSIMAANIILTEASQPTG